VGGAAARPARARGPAAARSGHGRLSRADGASAQVADSIPVTSIARPGISRLSSPLLNSLVQAAKRRARGYRSTPNYIAMIYLTVGKLDLGATHTK
jgi:hypothetical protein